jgi:diadenosine tetraphosphate (Ap4A) HIT family hydrolase
VSTGLAPGCYSCDQQAAPALPPREDVVRTAHWRVAHAFNSRLPGWLVLLPTRHVLSFGDLSAAEADELGGLLRRMSLALEHVTACLKTYVMQFSEAEGFSHLHVHLVPRMPEHPAQARGPAVFSFLSDDESEWIPGERRDELALALRSAYQEA